ncbi:hypothetical protein ACH5RR_002722 [Cinchona calisaya]|uniref:Uncharacterized protein n=1 Tax=Cinchona calisaya TaxID=153742 RepID=A0ABD3AT63_9GENT
MRKFCLKLKALKAGLKEFDKEFYGNMPNRIQQLKMYLEQVKEGLQNYANEISLHLANRKCTMHYANLIITKKMSAKNKARIYCLHEENWNIRFFHIKSHHAMTRMLTLLDNNGEKIEEYKEVKDHAVSFFQFLFTEKGPFSETHKTFHGQLTSRHVTEE